MATGLSPRNRDLNEADLAELNETLFQVRRKYVNIGLLIGVKKSEIETFEVQYNHHADKCLLEILKARVNMSTPFTWNDILKCLRSNSVGEGKLADFIEQKFESTGNKCRVECLHKEASGSKGLAVFSSSSESDSSSPESEQLKKLTETQKKKLIKIFRHSFGALCCIEFNPKQTAVLLQKKGLISQTTMKKMIMSPESRQDKIICLVAALQKRIKLHPHYIFPCIEVLIQHEDLQEEGKVILQDTGKFCCFEQSTSIYIIIILGIVCPERALSIMKIHGVSAEIFSPKLAGKYFCMCINYFLMNQLFKKYIGTELKVQEKSVDQNKEASTTATSTATDTELPAAEQVTTYKAITPPLTKYKAYLVHYYNARELAAADKYLPTQKASYINLAIVLKGRTDCIQRDEFTKKTLHGGVDQILESKQPINIEDLLVPENREPLRFILVEGPPGIGKSTFAWEVCRRWDDIESLRNYHTVVLLKLREKWVLNATKLSDIFRYPSDPEFSVAIAEDLNETHGCKLLLVLDGFDEVSHSFHTDSIVKSILCRELLPECTIILTTRPSAKHILETICQPRVDKHVEIIGFTEEERVRYITKFFGKEPELQVNFLKYMFLLPHIKSMMYIPLNCAIISQVYYESQQSSHHLAIPRTRTQLFKALTHSLLVRHMKMKDNCEYTHNIFPESLSNDDMHNFKLLAKFAFDTYHTVEEQKLIHRFKKAASTTTPRKVTFFKEDIPEGFVHFGFMNEYIEMYAGKGVEQTFSFLHLSLQEYLAAWHLAHSYSTEFHMAYHKLAALGSGVYFANTPYIPRGFNSEEKAIITSLSGQGQLLSEPALFLAGITGFRAPAKGRKSPWVMYLTHETADSEFSISLLVRSLYEAQNQSIISHFFKASKDRTNIIIGGSFIDSYSTPYDYYALSYCVANSLNEVKLYFVFKNFATILFVGAFVKGLDDHYVANTPKIKDLVVKLEIDQRATDERDLQNSLLLWLSKSNFMPNVKKLHFGSLHELNSSHALKFFEAFKNLEIALIQCENETSWVWLAGLSNCNQLKILHVYNIYYYNSFYTHEKNCDCFDCIFGRKTVMHNKMVLKINFPYNSPFNFRSSTDLVLGCLLRRVLIPNHFTEVCLPNISRENMAIVRNILLHFRCLVMLKLERTRLGYDGILYICSALRSNKTMRYLLIHDEPKVPNNIFGLPNVHLETIALSNKNTCTDFVLALNNILKNNHTLVQIDVRSGLFLPLSIKSSEYCQWTGLGPLQQFNLGALKSDRSPNLRRSFSSSDLTQPERHIFCKSRSYPRKINIQPILSSKRKQGKKLLPLPAYTAPDTDIFHPFLHLDYRLRICLKFGLIFQKKALFSEDHFRNCCQSNFKYAIECTAYHEEHFTLKERMQMLYPKNY